MDTGKEKKDNSSKRSSRGGYRPGSGRKPGSRDQISIRNLLDALDQRTGGHKYEDLLVEDFLEARVKGDDTLTLKYHNLILNKVMSSLARIEVDDSKDAIEAKQAAFATALARLVGVDPDNK